MEGHGPLSVNQKHRIQNQLKVFYYPRVRQGLFFFSSEKVEIYWPLISLDMVYVMLLWTYEGQQKRIPIVSSRIKNNAHFFCILI